MNGGRISRCDEKRAHDENVVGCLVDQAADSRKRLGEVWWDDVHKAADDVTWRLGAFGGITDTWVGSIDREIG